MADVYANSRMVDVGEVNISLAEHGDPDGSAVMLIHGFPDSARLWRCQLRPLVEAGYRVLLPDIRGYGRSDKPAEVGAYKLATVAADMVAILDDSNASNAHVVGHDWGAAISWYLAIAHSDRVRSLTALSVGHPASVRGAGIAQAEKSWYMLLFQFEEIAEKWLSQDDWRGLRSWLGPHPEMENWIQNLSPPGALTSALGLYRANTGPERYVAPPRELPPIGVPVMGVWSTGDVALLEPQMAGSGEFVAGEWRYERIEGASHWIPLDAAEQLNGLLLEWFAGH